MADLPDKSDVSTGYRWILGAVSALILVLSLGTAWWMTTAVGISTWRSTYALRFAGFVFLVCAFLLATLFFAVVPAVFEWREIKRERRSES